MLSKRAGIRFFILRIILSLFASFVPFDAPYFLIRAIRVIRYQNQIKTVQHHEAVTRSAPPH